tara:strand:- start:1256 stop:1423 length:168 start_codon:yes stop_codon:yes gene_type:complete
MKTENLTTENLTLELSAGDEHLADWNFAVTYDGMKVVSAKLNDKPIPVELAQLLL